MVGWFPIDMGSESVCVCVCVFCPFSPAAAPSAVSRRLLADAVAFPAAVAAATIAAAVACI